MSRRDFLKVLGTVTAGAVALPVTAQAAPPKSGSRWGLVVDVAKCIGCQACTVACASENRIPEDGFRTIVATYEVRQDIRTDLYTLPRQCNHCEDPPCVEVCPVGATFRREDGVVLVDGERCVGCAYCVQACPYDARFINHVTGKADKCTFCGHRLEAGLLPACVETCVGGARLFGDLNDPSSRVSQVLAKGGAKVLKPEERTRPSVFYLGLDERFDGRVEARAVAQEA